MASLGSFYQNIRSARTTLRDIGRLREIAAVLVRHGFGYVVENWRYRNEAIVSPITLANTETHHLSGPERLVVALQELGPTFVKLGQILSTRSDLIPPNWCQEFSRLQDNVEPFSSTEVRAVVEEALGDTIASTFLEFDDEPLASASIAQVHVAKLVDGDEVVIKIQRPGIASKIESDLSLLYWVARQLEDGLPEARAFAPLAIVAEFEKSIVKELNFKNEVAHLQRFEGNFRDWAHVHIPAVYPDLSSSRLMVMERLRGVKITDAEPLGHDMPKIAHECVHMIFKMVFEDGFFHGDLHPGNLLVLEDGRIGLIDFGLVGRMSRLMKDGMAELLLAIVLQDVERVARALYSLSHKRGAVDYEAYEQDVADLMIYHFQNASLGEIDFGAYLQEIVEGGMRHNLSVPANYTMFFKALMTVEGIGKKVSPDLDLLEECRPYVEKLVAERYGPERLMSEATQLVAGLGAVVPRLPTSLNALLGIVEEGKFQVVVSDPDAKRRDLAADRRMNRLSAMVFGIGFSLFGICLGNGQLDGLSDALGLSELTQGLLGFGSGAIGLSLLGVLLLKILLERNW